MNTTRSWLDSLGLSQYAAAFEANDVDEEVLKTLSEQDLKDLGVASLGHRRKLIAEIAIHWTDSDMYKALDVLAREVRIRRIFFRRPGDHDLLRQLHWPEVAPSPARAAGVRPSDSGTRYCAGCMALVTARRPISLPMRSPISVELR
ncbi:MAG: SAM domain-containing protein [Burkholderiales bacterium]